MHWRKCKIKTRFTKQHFPIYDVSCVDERIIKWFIMIVKTGVLLFFEHVSLCKSAVSDADGTCVEAELKGIFYSRKILYILYTGQQV